MRDGNCAQQHGECEKMKREFENKNQTDLYEQPSIYFGSLVQNKCVQKVVAKFEANSMHACLTPLVIKRNWQQQPKSLEQKKGKNRKWLNCCFCCG